MERKTAELGQRPPDAGEETTGEMTEDAAGRAAGDPEGEMARDPADEPETGFGGELPDEPVERRPATGEPRVDAALARLDELEGLPVTEHRAVFEDVHRRLQDVLGELDAGQPREAGHGAGPAGRPGR